MKERLIDNRNIKNLSFVVNHYINFLHRKGYLPKMFNPYNESEIKDIAPTMSTCCGSTTSSATILILEGNMDDNTKINVIGNYMPSGHNASRIVDSEGVAPTVKENHGTVTATNTPTMRIRKLTPKECWRLMGFSDESFEKAQKVNSNTQLYKQAGNSIVVNVLEKIINNLHLELEHIKLLELFGGIGACSEAMKNLGLDFEIVDYVEIDKYACASYNAINGTDFKPQDITMWDKKIDANFIMHGSPCQDFSLAGKQAGGDEGSGTRSSLMYETIRIVEKLRPKYVLWENVKNIISKKHRHNFDKYLKYMEDLGYKNYYQVLNAKDYGIPQNRERVFTVSILGDDDYNFPNGEENDNQIKRLFNFSARQDCRVVYDKNGLSPTLVAGMGEGGGKVPMFIENGFEFPPKQELKLKLKDMLEDEVDEKYYLSDEQVKRIHVSTYNVSKTRIQEKEYCQTLCARDWKDPKCVKVAFNLKGTGLPWDKMYTQTCNVYDTEGISPTLDTMQGGYRQPKVVENKFVNKSTIETLTTENRWSDLD